MYTEDRTLRDLMGEIVVLNVFQMAFPEDVCVCFAARGHRRRGNPAGSPGLFIGRSGGGGEKSQYRANLDLLGSPSGAFNDVPTEVCSRR